MRVSARQTALVVANYIFRGALIMHRKPSATLTDFQQFLAEAGSTRASDTRQSFTQRLNDCGRQRFARRLRNLACETICLWVLDA
jgi:hypothetical protein